jgi:hypothetical protein
VLTASIDGTAGLWDARTGFLLSTALKHQALVEHAQFSPDGRRIATASFDYTVRIWEIAQAGAAAPAWLPDLAEAVVGERLSEQRVAVDVPAGRFLQLKSRLESLSGDEDYARWARWFVADRSTRAVSPSARHSKRDFVAGLTARWPGKDSLSYWFEGAKLEPTNGVVAAGIAWTYLELGYTDRTVLQTSDWHSRRALELAPGHLNSWRVRVRSLERNGDTNAAVELFERGSALASGNPWYWAEWAGALEKAGRISEAWQKWDRTFAMLQTQPQMAGPERLGFARYGSEFLRNRASLLGASLPQGLDRLRALLGIPARDPSCPANLIDLTSFYSWGLDKPWLTLEHRRLDLRALPHGRTNLAGVEFDIRGLVQVSSAVLDDVQFVFPRSFLNIPVNQRCRRLHFLHGADVPEVDGTQVGAYLVRYTDGQQHKIPIVYGQNTLAWLVEGEQRERQTPAVAWKTTAPGGVTLQLCRLTWDNPRPDVAIETIDFVSKMTQAAPFLLAVTAEPQAQAFHRSATGPRSQRPSTCLGLDPLYG